LYYRIAGSSVAAHETPATNDYGGGGVKRSRLLDLLSLTSPSRTGIYRQRANFNQSSVFCTFRSLSNATLTLLIARRAFLIMGDKSPKANQKHKAQQQAKANSAAQKKEQQASAAKPAPRKK